MRPITLACLLLVLPVPTIVHAQDADPAAGEAVFKKCMVCHAVGEGARPKIGPPLNGVVGGPWAHYEGFAYSKALTDGKAAGRTWDEATLLQFLENPKGTVAGTKMAFPGLKKADERANVVAYLKSLALDGRKVP